MSILIDETSRVIVQGITGTAGRFHTERMLAYGTNIVGGTSPGKGGEVVHGAPVFDSVVDALSETDADTAVIFLPAPVVLDAAIESIRAGIDGASEVRPAERSIENAEPTGIHMQ
ncbi:MAG: hypothetical protein IH969_06625 [Candidatus Krumholzibacteriota bacterium]|nr:hypothetical protein [Candidatus Krumholzibacteriota bacterium]